jgi:uncharacterized membrane protein
MLKFCHECGEKLKSENAAVCTSCGVSLTTVSAVAGKKWSGSTLGILYFLAFFMPLFGGIGGIVGLFNPKNRGHGAGLIIISFFSWIFWFSFLLALGI